MFCQPATEKLAAALQTGRVPLGHSEWIITVFTRLSLLAIRDLTRSPSSLWCESLLCFCASKAVVKPLFATPDISCPDMLFVIPFLVAPCGSFRITLSLIANKTVSKTILDGVKLCHQKGKWIKVYFSFLELHNFARKYFSVSYNPYLSSHTMLINTVQEPIQKIIVALRRVVLKRTLAPHKYSVVQLSALRACSLASERHPLTSAGFRATLRLDLTSIFIPISCDCTIIDTPLQLVAIREILV